MRKYLDIINNILRESILDNSAFKNWFGNSKMIDVSGQPLIFYHGTDTEFSKFDTRDGRRGDGGIFEFKVKSPFKFFTRNINYAADVAANKADYGRGHIFKVYLRIINPLDLTTKNGMRAAHDIFGLVDEHSDVIKAKNNLANAKEELEDIKVSHKKRGTAPQTIYQQYDNNGEVIGSSTRSRDGYRPFTISSEQIIAAYKEEEQEAQDAIDIANKHLTEVISSQEQPESVWNYFDDEESAITLLKAGYDGIIFKENDGDVTYAVIHSNQIKSIKNKGSYTDDDDIHEDVS